MKNKTREFDVWFEGTVTHMGYARVRARDQVKAFNKASVFGVEHWYLKPNCTYTSKVRVTPAVKDNHETLQRGHRRRRKGGV